MGVRQNAAALHDVADLRLAERGGHRVEWAERFPDLATEYLTVEIVHRDIEERVFSFRAMGEAAGRAAAQFRGVR